MIRHHAYCMDPNRWESSLSAREPFEDRAIQVAVWPKEESGLVAARRKQVVLTRNLSS